MGREKTGNEKANRGNVLDKKSGAFAVRILKFSLFLNETRKGLSSVANQILKSGTSIGANIRESSNAASKKDFILKLTIALKEANETQYWLEILRESKVVSEKQFESLYADCSELAYLLTASVKTAKRNLASEK